MNKHQKISFKIAEDLVYAENKDYDYIPDPDHKKHPGGGYHKTEKGWSNLDEKEKKEPVIEDNDISKEDMIIHVTPEKEIDDNSYDIENKRDEALENTLDAVDFYGNNYSETFYGEWESMSEDDRIAIINQDYDETSEEYEKERKKSEHKEYSLALYDAIDTCIDKTTEYAESLGYEVHGKNMSNNADSGYISVYFPESDKDFKIRFSNHKQPSEGSYYTDKYGNSGRKKADYSLVLKDDTFDLSEIFSYLKEYSKLSPEMKEKVKDWDEEDIAKFIGWLKKQN